MASFLGDIYIIENIFDPPSDITAIPQSYTVHCIIAGAEVEEFHYYNSDTELTTACYTEQNGYNCSLSTNSTITSDVTPDNVVDKTITVTLIPEEINGSDDHLIRCQVRHNDTTRESTVIIRGTCMCTKHVSEVYYMVWVKIM